MEEQEVQNTSPIKSGKKVASIMPALSWILIV